jgi:hypothetical protein
MPVVDAEKAALILSAALAGDVRLLRSLLQPCGDPAGDGLPDSNCRVTPLMAAAAAGHEAAIEVLLECGVDAARLDPRGRTAAYYARCSGHTHLAERLDTVVNKEQTIW